MSVSRVLYPFLFYVSLIRVLLYHAVIDLGQLYGNDEIGDG